MEADHREGEREGRMRCATTATLLVLVSALAATSGCYFSQSRIIESGLDARILPGQYGCRFPADPGFRDLRVTVAKESPRPKDTVYIYEVDDQPSGTHTKATARLGKLKSGLYFIQVEGPSWAGGQGFSYSFIDLRTSKLFDVVVQRQSYADRAEKLGLKFKSTAEWFVGDIGTLTGSLDATVAFLESFTWADLQTALTCRYQGP
jgi:hypothetical protein